MFLNARPNSEEYCSCKILKSFKSFVDFFGMSSREGVRREGASAPETGAAAGALLFVAQPLDGHAPSSAGPGRARARCVLQRPTALKEIECERQMVISSIEYCKRLGQ